MTKPSACQTVPALLFAIQAKQLLQQLLLTFHAAEQQPQWLLVQLLTSEMLWLHQHSLELLLALQRVNQLLKGQKALLPQPEQAQPQLLGTSSPLLLPMLPHLPLLPWLVLWQNLLQTHTPMLPVQQQQNLLLLLHQPNVLSS